MRSLCRLEVVLVIDVDLIEREVKGSCVKFEILVVQLVSAVTLLVNWVQ